MSARLIVVRRHDFLEKISFKALLWKRYLVEWNRYCYHLSYWSQLSDDRGGLGAQGLRYKDVLRKWSCFHFVISKIFSIYDLERIVFLFIAVTNSRISDADAINKLFEWFIFIAQSLLLSCYPLWRIKNWVLRKIRKDRKLTRLLFSLLICFYDRALSENWTVDRFFEIGAFVVLW